MCPRGYFVLLAVPCLLGAQAISRDQIKRIRSGDQYIFLDLGKAKDAKSMRAELSALLGTEKLNSSQLRYAYGALARLGDDDAFRQLTNGICEPTVNARADTFRLLEYVGDERAVAFLLSLFPYTTYFPWQKFDIDTIDPPFAKRAMVSLAEFVRPAPASGGEAIAAYFDHQVKVVADKWLAWARRQPEMPKPPRPKCLEVE